MAKGFPRSRPTVRKKLGTIKELPAFLQKKPVAEGVHLMASPGSHVSVRAGAGCGKTTTMEWGYNAKIKGIKPPHKPSLSQEAIIESFSGTAPTASVKFVCFNSSVKDEFVNRGLPGSTNHSLGFAAVRNSFRGVQIDKGGWGANNYCVDIEHLDPKKDWETIKLTSRMVSLAKMTLAGWRPGMRFDELCPPDIWAEDFNGLINHYGIDLNGKDDQIMGLVPKILNHQASQVGRIGFDDMIWLPVVRNLPLERNDLLIVDERQDLNLCQMELLIRSGERIIGVGDKCQPAGTKVTKVVSTGNRWSAGTTHDVDIEDLKVGDHVVSYSTSDCAFLKSGRKVKGITKRPYDGDLVCVETELVGSEDWTGEALLSRYTPDHHCIANFKPLADKHVVYLMKRGAFYRLGKAKMSYGDKLGAGPMLRMRAEDADAVWLLSLHDSDQEARYWEEAYSAKFGIPQLMFTNKEGVGGFPQEQLDSLWSFIGDLEDRARLVLKFFNRDVRYPMYSRVNDFKSVDGKWRTQGMKRPRVVRACNLMEGVLVLPYTGNVHVKASEWVPVKSIEREHYEGYVYSLTVEKSHVYVADGIVTHNCQAIYGFAGADAESFERMDDWMSQSPRGIASYPLMETRRCPKCVVELAQTLVPEFTALPEAPQGRIHRDISWDVLLGEKPSPAGTDLACRKGDMLLCRVNAPLIQMVYRFIREGITAHIQGRDIGEGLLSMVKKSKADDIGQLISWGEDQRNKETEKAMKSKFPSESKLQAINDKYDCLAHLCVSCDTINALVDRINTIFPERQPDRANTITLSSVHRAKGLEAKRVYILCPEKMPLIFKNAQPWEKAQEQNICYVAWTRTKNELIFTTTPQSKNKGLEE